MRVCSACGSAFATAILCHEFIDKSTFALRCGLITVAKQSGRLKVYKECAEARGKCGGRQGEGNRRTGGTGNAAKREKARLMSLGRW